MLGNKRKVTNAALGQAFRRDDEIDEMVSLIVGHQLVLIYAPSGAGKTLIINTQVKPELEKKGFDVSPVARVGIGSNTSTNSVSSNTNIRSIPNVYLLNTFHSLISNGNGPLISSSTSLLLFLKNNLPPKRNNRGELTPQVIIFDQFEEIFNIYPGVRWREQQQEFFEQIAEALNNNPLLRIVFTIREEYLAQLDPFVEILPESLRPRIRLERLRREVAYEAIKGSLERTGLPLDDAVIDKLADNLLNIRIQTATGELLEVKGEFVEPILLQVVCQRLWEKSLQNATISIDDLQSEVDKALEDFYEDCIREAANQANMNERDISKWCEKKLITSSGTRSIVHLEPEYTGGLPNKVIEILQDKCLIRREWRSGAPWYELTHDRLIKSITDSNRNQNYGQRKKSSRSLKL